MMTKIMPELPLSDVAAGITYFRDILGFGINYQQDDLGVMDRDDVRVLLIARTDRHSGACATSACWIRRATRSPSASRSGEKASDGLAPCHAVTEPPIPILTMTFAKRVFLIAGIYGLVVLLPQYFMEEKTGRDYPPPVTHPEYFYGFIGVAVAWQIVFLIISRDPVRYRPIMLAAIVEKASFGIAAVALYLAGRLGVQMLGAGIIDLILGTLFTIAYLRTHATMRTVVPPRAD